MMLWKPIATLVFMAFMVPGEPDVGLGKPAAFESDALNRVHARLFAALDRVRADLDANKGRGR